MIIEILAKWFFPFMATTTISMMLYIIRWFKKVDKVIEDLPKLNKEIQSSLTTCKSNISELKELTIENDLAMLWAQIKVKCDKITETKTCSISSKECLLNLLERYKKIGGNHSVDIMVKEALSYCKNSVNE